MNRLWFLWLLIWLVIGNDGCDIFARYSAYGVKMFRQTKTDASGRLRNESTPRWLTSRLSINIDGQPIADWLCFFLSFLSLSLRLSCCHCYFVRYGLEETSRFPTCRYFWSMLLAEFATDLLIGYSIRISPSWMNWFDRGRVLIGNDCVFNAAATLIDDSATTIDFPVLFCKGGRMGEINPSWLLN